MTWKCLRLLVFYILAGYRASLDSQAQKSINAVFVTSEKSVLVPDLEKEQKKNSPTFILMHWFLEIALSDLSSFIFAERTGLPDAGCLPDQTM